MFIFFYFLMVVFLFSYYFRFNKSSEFIENNKSLNLEKVSIVIPFYNEEKVIKKTIDQILDLNLKGELIMIDDGSSDLSSSLVTKCVMIMKIQILK